MAGTGNVLFECSLNIAAERSLNIPFERSWKVPQEHSENIALERSKNPDIFLVLGTFLERSDGTFRIFHGNVHRTFREGIVLWGAFRPYSIYRNVQSYQMSSITFACYGFSRF